MSDNKETESFQEKMCRGLELSERRLLEETARRGESLCVGTEDGGVACVPAKALLEQYMRKKEEAARTKLVSLDKSDEHGY